MPSPQEESKQQPLTEVEPTYVVDELPFPPGFEGRTKKQLTLSEKRDRFFSFNKKSRKDKTGKLLKLDSLVDPAVANEIRKTGQITELSFGRTKTVHIWDHYKDHDLAQHLQEYDILDETKRLVTFRGDKMNLQVNIVYRAKTKELAVAFSGTSEPRHYLEDAKFNRKEFSIREGRKKPAKVSESAAQSDVDAVLKDSEPMALVQLMQTEADNSGEGEQTSAITNLLRAEASTRKCGEESKADVGGGEGEQSKGSLTPIEQAADLANKSSPIPGKGSGKSGKAYEVHAGFLNIFKDLETRLITELHNIFYPPKDGKDKLEIETLSLCGHSLGASQVYLGALVLLDSSEKMITKDGKEFVLPKDLKIKLYTYGSPRVGLEPTRDFYRQLLKEYRSKSTHGKAAIEEYCVRNYNDGVPCLPPYTLEIKVPLVGKKKFELGYVHFTERPIYAFNGDLYWVDPADYDCVHFPVEVREEPRPDEKAPRGGHLTYNRRQFYDVLAALEDGLAKIEKAVKKAKKAAKPKQGVKGAEGAGKESAEAIQKK